MPTIFTGWFQGILPENKGGTGVTTGLTLIHTDALVGTIPASMIVGPLLVTSSGSGVTAISLPVSIDNGGTGVTGSNWVAGDVTVNSVNGIQILSGTGTLNMNGGFLAGALNKELSWFNSLGFTGTDGNLFNFPSGSDQVVVLGATQTLTAKTLSAPIFTGNATSVNFSISGTLKDSTGSVGGLGNSLISLVTGTLWRNIDTHPFYVAVSTISFNSTASAVSLLSAGSPNSSVVGPANSFGVGSGFRIYGAGLLSCTISPPSGVTITLKLGSITIAQIVTPIAQVNNPEEWRMEFLIVCRSTGTNGSVSVSGEFRQQTSTSARPFITSFTPAVTSGINTTTTQTISLTAAWSASDPLNVFECDQLMMFPIPAP